jgi:hypothetical protein
VRGIRENRRGDEREGGKKKKGRGERKKNH